MEILFHGKVAKDINCEEYNEDAYAFSCEHSLIAVSDGATDSYDSKTLAELVANQFIQNPNITKDWIQILLEKYNTHHDYSSLSWSKQAAFERGSFASLLGASINYEEKTINVISVGDSLAILLDQNNYIKSYPYTTSEEFNQRPELFSSLFHHNNFTILDDFHSTHNTTWIFSEYLNPLLLCMTDAFGQWILKNEENNTSVLDIVCNIRTIEQLQDLVMNARADKDMKIDDVTLILIDLNEKVERGLSIS